jgi:hypothetical protein
MEWFRADCRIDDPHPSFFDELEQLRSRVDNLPGTSAWLGKSYPTPSHMQIWLRFSPALPLHLQPFVAHCGFVASSAAEETNPPITWSQLFGSTAVDEKPVRLLPALLRPHSGSSPAQSEPGAVRPQSASIFAIAGFKRASRAT